MSEELVPVAPMSVVAAAPLRISLICACGAGWPNILADDWRTELEDHIARRHPDARGYALTLSAYPVER